MHSEDDIPEFAPADYASAAEVVKLRAPEHPVHLLRPQLLYSRTMSFHQGFSGTTAYAVRANSEPRVLQELHNLQIDWFACDTLAEIEAVARLLPDARILYMHPLKSERAIHEAYHKYRIRTFVIDHPDELRKVRQYAGPDCTLLVRILTPPGGKQVEGYRFGCDVEKAAWLAGEVVDAGFKLGLSFNLGSQVLNPQKYDEAFLIMREVMYRARYMLDMVCVGGGFPSIYEGAWPAPMTDYFKVLDKSLSRLHLPRTCQVIATPGRALVADAVAVLAKVEQRRGQLLYLNDGLMGSLSGINNEWSQPPVRLIRAEGRVRSRMEKFLFSGPATFVEDVMPGPFYLPEDTREGDYIEIGQVGAYSLSLHSAFGGAPWPEMFTVSDDPPIPKHEEELPHDYHSGSYESHGDHEDEEVVDYAEEIDDSLSYDDEEELPHRREE